MSNNPQGTVTTTIKDDIAYIQFAHPAHNAMPGAQLARLAQAIQDAGDNAEAKVIVLGSGGDRTFCAGASFDELMAIENLDTGKAFFMGFANVINAMRTCPKFIIGRVQGKAVGGGVGLASATDFCVSTKYASVKLSELAIGIGPFVVGPAVAHKIGNSAFTAMSIDAADWRSAYWAKEKGLFAEVFDHATEMDEYIYTLAQKLVKYSPEAMAELKKVFWAGTENWDTLLPERAAISGRLVLSDFTKDFIKRFKS